MRTRYVLPILICAATRVSAQPPASPTITLSVEQPAYTSLPVWLHVTSRNACLEDAGAPSSPGAEFTLYLWMRPDGPEVTRDGIKLSRTPFIDPATAKYGYFNIHHGPCDSDDPQTGEYDHRFALTGAYTFDHPGHYRVRWTTTLDGGGPVSGITSNWLDFDVIASKPGQRDAWRAGMLKTLAGGKSSDGELIGDIIPALVADWRNPNTADVLLDVACHDSVPVRSAATSALAWTLSAENARHFADLVISDSCHLSGGNRAQDFVERHAREFAVVRSDLLRAFARQLDKPVWQPYEAGNILGMMAALRGSASDTASNETADKFADGVVLHVSPRVLAPHDAVGKNSTQVDTAALVDYLTSHKISSTEHNLLRRLANDPGLEFYGIDALMDCHDASDLPYLESAIVHARGIFGNYTGVIDKLTETYGRRAIPMLRNIARHAEIYQNSLRASYHLVMLGDPAGAAQISSGRQGGSWVAQRDAARTLNQLVAHHIPLGSLEKFCPGTKLADPCNAESLKPPGACEPHFAC